MKTQPSFSEKSRSSILNSFTKTPARYWAWACGALLCLGATAAQFADVTTGAGILNEGGNWCFGGAWGDYNNDGLIDLYVAIGVDTPCVNALYRNNGNGTFTRVGAEAGPITTDSHPSLGCAWIDFNNDGFRDMFVVNGSSGGSQDDLYWNNGDGTFRRSYLTPQPWVEFAWPACADYDGDGWVDIFLAQGTSTSGPFTLLLYHNTGSGTFTPVDCLGPPLPWANAGVWGDYDNDGDPDLFVCNGEGNVLWRNDGGGRFVAMDNGLPWGGIYGNPVWHAAWADYDRDGDLDIALGTAGGTGIYRNDGTAGFAMATFLPNLLMCPAWADYDNDGRLDLVAAVATDTAKRAALYHNNGDGTFTQAVAEFPLTGDWLGSPWGDFDNDGFMDLFFAEGWGANRLYRNLGNTNGWIKFKLIGTASNRDAIGAKVRVQATIAGQAVQQMQEVNGGYLLQNDTRLNFGLGDATVVEKVRVEWPSGVKEEFSNIAPRQILTIVEPSLIGTFAQDGKFHLAMTMSTNRLYQLQASTDLLTWTTLTNCTGSGSCARIEYVDSDAPTAPVARFYRMK